MGNYQKIWKIYWTAKSHIWKKGEYYMNMKGLDVFVQLLWNYYVVIIIDILQEMGMQLWIYCYQEYRIIIRDGIII